MQGWEGFKPGIWQEEVDVRNFIQLNYQPYDGDESFLQGPTDATKQLLAEIDKYREEEMKRGGMYDLDTEIISSITSHAPGYINKDLEAIVGLQTDKPFKRAIMPKGGIRMVENIAQAYGYEISPKVVDIYTNYRKSHNQGVYDVYTPQMRLARKSGVITGLPDSYGRGRIIGDYRRVALYGVDFLINQKEQHLLDYSTQMDEEVIRHREEIREQINALSDLKKMASSYGYDISQPATNAKEAIQWLYFGYLAAIKDQNGAAMSLGRVSTFLDIYIQRDLDLGIITESEAQEYIDHFVMKLRLVKFARTPEYNELFSGDPTWVTESIGGMGLDGRSLVTKTSFRIIHTLDNLQTAPEPNLTVLWSNNLPINFKNYCAMMSIKTSAIQYENDDIMRITHGDDYAIACCVSPMKVGKQMQFFGARANLAKALTYAINGGVDELLNIQVAPKFAPILDEYLDYDDVIEKYDTILEWLAELYVNTLNVIHYMHDKYAYEALEMALHDDEVERFFATGIAGLSVVADSLSAIKYAKVKTIRNDDGIVVDYQVEGDYPKYGNNDQRADEIAIWVVETFMKKIKKHKTYRHSIPTQSILTITSNVVYGSKTGNTPDGRRSGEPFAPGANPMHGRDHMGAIASLASVSKIPFKYACDGISNTFSIIPEALGKDSDNIIELDGISYEELGLNAQEFEQLVSEVNTCPTC